MPGQEEDGLGIMNMLVSENSVHSLLAVQGNPETCAWADVIHLRLLDSAMDQTTLQLVCIQRTYTRAPSFAYLQVKYRSPM